MRRFGTASNRRDDGFFFLAVRLFSCALLYLCLPGGCAEEGTPAAPTAPIVDPGYVYAVPETTDDGWTTTHLDSVGIDAVLIMELMDLIPGNTVLPDLHSLLIVRDGRLVFEEYFEDWTRDRRHMLMSCTKSVTSALVGIAIDEGYVSGVDTGVYAFFPEYDSLRTPRRDSLLLRHAMTMTGGLEWDQESYAYSDPRNSLYQMLHLDSDWRGFVLGLDAVYSPGGFFAYSDGMAMLVGEVLTRSLDRSVMDWADDKLLMPLGITNRAWLHRIGGVLYGAVNTGYGLYLRPRDMAKFGQLYLDGGVWQGEQIVPADWVNRSMAAHVIRSSTVEYGYFWWRVNYRLDDGRRFQMIAASGNYGQFICIFPALNEVIVFTMGRPSNQGGSEAGWALKNYILPASAPTGR